MHLDFRDVMCCSSNGLEMPCSYVRNLPNAIYSSWESLPSHLRTEYLIHSCRVMNLTVLMRDL